MISLPKLWLRLSPLLLGLGCCATAGPHKPPYLQQSAALQTDATAMEKPIAGRPFVSPYSYAHFARAEIYRHRGNWAAAATGYRQALVGADSEPHALVRYAEALAHNNQPDAALSALAEAESVAPRSAEIQTARARIERDRGRFKAALAAYQRALDLRPDRADAAIEIANLLTNQGDPEAGLAILTGFSANRSDLTGEVQRARLQLGLERNDLNLVANAARALASTGQHSGLLLKASAKHLRAGDCRQAQALIGAIADNSTSAALRLRTLLACRELDQASDLLLRYPDTALGGFPHVAEALLAVGLYGRALESAQAAELLHRDDPKRKGEATAIANRARAALAKPQLNKLQHIALAALQQALEALDLDQYSPNKS